MLSVVAVCLLGGDGQAQGLPLRELLGNGDTVRGEEGRHKACPYGIFWRMLTSFGGERAGTRPAPTRFSGDWRRCAGGRGQAQGLPLRDFLANVDFVRGGEGRHEACPYGIFWRMLTSFGGKRAGTRPAPARFSGDWRRCAGGRGQAQGLPLRDFLANVDFVRGGEGRHKACPYGILWRLETLDGGERAGTRPAPTGAGRMADAVGGGGD